MEMEIVGPAALKITAILCHQNLYRSSNFDNTTGHGFSGDALNMLQGWQTDNLKCSEVFLRFTN